MKQRSSKETLFEPMKGLVGGRKSITSTIVELHRSRHRSLLRLAKTNNSLKNAPREVLDNPTHALLCEEKSLTDSNKSQTLPAKIITTSIQKCLKGIK